MGKRTMVWRVLACAMAMGVVLVAQGPLTPIGQLRGRTDAAGSLYTVAAAVSGAQGPLTPIAQLRGRTDSNGSLFTTVAGGTVTPDKVCLDATNQDACLQRNGAGILQLGNAATSTDFNRLQFGGSTAAFPSLKRSTTTLTVRLADDSNDGDFTARSISYSLRIIGPSATIMSATAPSALSACGSATNPSFAWTNGTGAFEIITGGSVPVATCTWTMPAATNKWVCDITDITTQNANVFVQKMSASSTTSVTMTNYNTAGAATAVVASDHLLVKCLGG